MPLPDRHIKLSLDKESTVKTTEIDLPYFKQGDDLGSHLHEGLHPIKALEAHAAQLDEAAAMLRRIEEVLSEAVDFHIVAQCHTIMRIHESRR